MAQENQEHKQTGRPPLPPEERKDKQFSVALSGQDKKELTSVASRRGLAVGAFVRQIVMERLDAERSSL